MKPQPHNLEAEQAILGGLFINPDKVPSVQKDLSADDFYREAHQHIARVFFEVDQ